MVDGEVFHGCEEVESHAPYLVCMVVNSLRQPTTYHVGITDCLHLRIRPTWHCTVGLLVLIFADGAERLLPCRLRMIPLSDQTECTVCLTSGLSVDRHIMDWGTMQVNYCCKSGSQDLTCRGSLFDAIVVKPTMSEKNIETQSKVSGCTGWPSLSLPATCL